MAPKFNPTPEFAGITFPRTTPAEILAEIERQKKVRHDLVVSTKQITMKTDDEHGLVLEVEHGRGKHVHPMTKGTMGQLCDDIGLNRRSRLFYRLRHGSPDPRKSRSESFDSTRYYQTWCDMVNDIMRTEHRRRLVRGMVNEDGQQYWRAFLSDSYLIIPNSVLFFSVAEAVNKAEAEIWHARLSEDNCFIYAVAPGVHGQVTHGETFDPGDGWQSRFYSEEGDVVNAAVTVKNSETGRGGCEIAPAIIRRVCANYCVWQNVYARRHLGERMDTDALLTDETLAKRSEVIFAELGDIVSGTFDEERFCKMLMLMDEAAQDEIADPVAAAEALKIAYDVSDARKEEIRKSLISSKDFTRFGLMNAVTNVAHNGDEIEHEVGHDLERLGAKLLDTTSAQLNEIWEKHQAEQEKDKKAKAEAAV